jgi:hypothetical protein
LSACCRTCGCKFIPFVCTADRSITLAG